MRPRKIILCVSDNEIELSITSFMLDTHGYRVIGAATGQEAIGIFSDVPIDLVLADYAMPVMNGDQLVKRLKQIASHIPMILLGDPKKMVDVLHSSDALLSKKGCSNGELLERVRIMSARKRGPRPGYGKKPPVSVTVAENVEMAV